MTEIKEPYKIAIAGSAGKGKTMSFRNMNPETCAFINMEGKPLPFINNFKHYYVPDTWQEAYQILINLYKNESITEVVFDSFSAYADSLLKTARETKKNFDIWNLYNEEIAKLLYLIKKYNKEIIISGHINNVESVNGVEERRLAIKGKEHNVTGIEHAFSLVVFSDVFRDPLTNKPSYKFIFNSDGITTAKTPPIFLEEDEEDMENDSFKLLTRVRDKLSNG